MRKTIPILVCVLAGRAAADPPSESSAKNAAAEWFRAAAAGDAATLRRLSAPALRVSIHNGLGCPIQATSRNEAASIVRRARKCLWAIPASGWHPQGVAGDTRVVEHLGGGETFQIFDVTVDARGLVLGVGMHTSYGGPP